MISNEIIIIAKRILKQQVLLAQKQIDMNMFMGLGMALATVYEVATGRRVVQEKITPQEVMQWALSLPQVPGAEVEIDMTNMPNRMPASKLV